MNKEVSFPIAKLLKEKGFDIPCREGWVNYLASFTGETRMPDDESNLVIDRLGNSHLIERPSIADVVMWLYEKHGIWIWVGCRELEDGTNRTIFIPQGRTIPSTKKDGFVVDIIPYTPKDSPTEAYEAAIEYTLNNLI